nr:MAG TPA: hypothetical protein [Caudoviricetes sp.]
MQLASANPCQETLVLRSETRSRARSRDEVSDRASSRFQSIGFRK